MGTKMATSCSTAIGTKMTTSYANIIVESLERRLIYYSPFKPLSWIRIIDDIEMKWIDGCESLDDFIELFP